MVKFFLKVTFNERGLNESYTLRAYRLSANQILVVNVLPEDAWTTSDIIAMLSSLAITPEHPIKVPIQLPSPAVSPDQMVTSAAIEALHPCDYGNEVEGSPIELHMPFRPNTTWKVGGAGSYYSDGLHTNNDYYATDWNINTGADKGEPVYPVANGTASIGGQWNGTSNGYGNYVYVIHDTNPPIRTRYAHLNSISVSNGDRVFTNTEIGTVGSTGTGSAVHLHLSFEVKIDGQWVSKKSIGRRPSPMLTKSGPWQLCDGESRTAADKAHSGEIIIDIPCDAPILKSPYNDFSGKNGDIKFEWDKNGCQQDDFTLRVSRSAKMEEQGKWLIDTGVGGTTYTPNSEQRNKVEENKGIDLYWSVKTVNGSEWATPRRFRIDANESPFINFQTANGNNANPITSRDQTWTFTGNASDPENRLDRVEFRCSGDGCGSGPDRTGGGNWSITRSGMTGKNDVYFRACDEKQCTESRHLDLNIDLSPPSTNVSIEGEKEGEWYHSAVNVRLHADDGSTGRARAGVKEIRYRIDGGGWQAQNGSDATVALTSDGNHTVEYYAVDHLGNAESAHSVSFKIDATPPTAISGVSESNGSPNDQWQKAKNIPAFTWAASSDNLSGLWGYQFYFGDNPNGEGYQSFTADQPRQWTPLPAGVRTGTYYLRGRARDNAGSYSLWATLFTYRYDGSAPENPETATHAAGATNDTWQRTTSQPNFTWPAPHDEGSGIKGYAIYWGDNPNGETADFSANAGFQSATPLCAANAACTGYLRVRSLDNVDNPADKWSSVFTLRYDGAPPVTNFTINGGVTQTNQTQIVLNLTASDQGSGLHAMRFSSDGVNWTEWEAYANERIWQIPAIGRQSWPVYVQVQDNVGLESAVVSRTTYFEVNRAQPRSEGFRLFDYTASAGAGTHTSASFQGRSTVGQVVDAARTGSANYRISGGYEAGSQAIPLIVPGHDTFLFINGVFASGVVATTMQSGSFRMIGTVGEVALPNNVTTLSSNNFRHQPGFLAADPSGQPLPVPTIVPVPGPTPTPTPAPDCEFPQVSINNGAVFTNNTNVTLNLCAPRAVQMMVSNDGGFGGVQWEAYGRSKTWTLTTLGQYVLPRYIYVAFKDAAGTIYSTYLDDIIYDPNPPNGTLAVGDSIPTDLLLQSATGMDVQAASSGMFDVGGVTFLRQIGSQALAAPLALRALNAGGTVDLFFNAQDDNSGIREMQISADASFNSAGWENYSALRPWTPTDGDGVKTLYARFRDSAGNVSAATNASFALDTQPPLGGIGVVDSIIGLDTVTVTLYLQAEDNLSGVADMRISSDSAFANALWQPFAGNVVWSVYPDAQQSTGSFYVQFRDRAGNVSQSYSTEYLIDTQPPIVYVEVDPGETLERTVRVYAYDELSALRTLSISNDPLLSEGVTTQAYIEAIPWIFDERQVVWLQVTDSVGNRSEPYPAYAALPDTQLPVEHHIYLPIIRR